MPKSKVVYQFPEKWWRASWDKMLFLFFLAVFVLVTPGQNMYFLTRESQSTLLRRFPFPIPTPAPYPNNVTGIYPGNEISAGGIVITDLDSGVLLYKRNEEQPLAPASTTKILTALVALDSYELDDVLTVKTVINNGQTMGLVPGERIMVENLLYGALIASGNDAAYALAENYPGGVEAFVGAMNDKAKALHLEKSSFTNPIGYDDPNHKMTPFDLSRLATVALSNRTISKMVAIPQITISDVTHTYFHSLKNINELLGKIPGVGGIKTGWTEDAGENLVTLVERNGRRVVVVVLHSKDRFGETTRLIDWIYDNYQWQTINPR